MNGKDIFLGLKYVGEDLIEQAEFGAFSESKHRRPVRPLLIAALVALLLMLVGCAVVYVLNMQSMKIGNIMESQPILSENYMDITGYRDVELQVLTLAGLKGSTNYKAAKEWHEFKESYDPNGEKYQELLCVGNLEEYPPDFNGLPIYTQEMRDAMDGILAKYNLLPPGEPLEFRTLKQMCTALGIEKIQTAQNNVDIRISHGYCNSNGNFYLNVQFSLPESEDLQYYDTWGNLYWCRKDCFTPEYTTIEDTNDWKEWNYTTTDGSEVLIFRSPSDWRGWIVCQRDEAQMVLQLEVRKDLMSDNHTEYQYLTDRQIEMIADAVDFSIQPKKVSKEDVKKQLPDSPNAVQNGWNVELKDVKTDGYMVRILLGITAPANVDITHVDADDYNSPYYAIRPGNDREFFIPEVGEKNGYSWIWIPEEDGDGLDNTRNIVMTCNISMMDGSAPFADGTVWELLVEDLMHEHWNSKKNDIETIVLAEGQWNFSIRFGRENGDYTKIDLLSEPITLPTITAWDAMGKPIWETSEVSNIEVHPMSLRFLTERSEIDFGWVNVVMKDGRKITADPTNYNAGCIYEASEWIDLNQVDYLLLQDGTIIPVPEN